MKNLKQLLLLAVVALGLATSCSKEEMECPSMLPPTVDKTTIAVGEELLINNSSTSQHGFSYEITEGDSFVEVLEKDSMHYIKGVAEGIATIMATNGGGSNELVITVGDLPSLATDLVLVGDSIRILNASNDLGFTYNITAGSENISVLDNDSVFYIVGKKGGSAVISLSNNFGELEDSVYVSNVYLKDGYYVDYQGVKYNIDEATGDAEVAGTNSGDGPNLAVDLSPFDGVLNIGANLYYEKGEFPVKSVGEKSFYNASGPGNLSIKELIFEPGSSIESVGKSAFYACDSIQTISFAGCTELTTIDSASFYSIENLETLDLSDCAALERIADFAFYEPRKLKALDLSDCSSLRVIGKRAFIEADALEELDFSACTSLEEIQEIAFYASGLIKSIVFPASLKSIDNSAFNGCSNLASVDLSACTNLNFLGTNAFNGAFDLETVDLSNCTLLTEIGGAAFAFSGLVSIQLPTTITTMGNNTFVGCEDLVDINISACTGLNYIGYSTFKDCDGVLPLTLPGTAAEWSPSNIVDATNWDEIFSR